jgi:hypothetical protein
MEHSIVVTPEGTGGTAEAGPSLRPGDHLYWPSGGIRKRWIAKKLK